MAPTRSTGPEVGACGYGCMERELASQSDGSNMDGENAESPAVELSLLCCEWMKAKTESIAVR